MKYSMFIADIDGTLRGHDSGFNMRIGEKTISSLQDMHDQGMILAIASGRPLWQELEEHNKQWGLNFQFDLIIGMNGGQLHDTRKDVIQEINPLTCEQLEYIYHHLEYLDLNPSLYRDGYTLTLREDEEILASAKRHFSTFKVCKDPSELWEMPTCKIMYRTQSVEMAEKVLDAGRTMNRDDISFFRTGPELVEFQSSKNNKGVALAKYCKENNIDLKDVIAFGDAENDIEMLKTAGYSVAVANALDPVKAIVNDVTRYDAFNDGVGDYLYTHLL